MFELQSMTNVRVLDVRTLAAKNREPNDLHGMQLLCQASLPVSALAMFDPALPAWIARKAPAEDQLPGIEKLELTEIGSHVKRIPWVYDQTGNTVEFDRGLGGNSNLKLSDCTVHRVSFKPQEGVAALVQWCIDAPSLTDAVRGKLTGLKALEVPMTQIGPDVGGQREIEEVSLTPKQLREANARGLTLVQAKEQLQGSPDKPWPFPKGGDGSGPDAKAKANAVAATDAVLADVKNRGAKPVAKKPAAKKTVKRKSAAVA